MYHSRYIDSEQLSFQYSLFGENDVEHNLDYVDSNGDRYPQELYSLDFTRFDIPHLRSSALLYAPSGSMYNLPYDTFQGMVTSEIPLVGTRRLVKSSYIRQLLRHHIAQNLSRTNLTVKHETNRVSIQTPETNNLEADFYAEILPENMLRLEVVVPTDYQLNNEERYDDTVFASELWVLLHDFAANLDTYAHTPAQSLGKIAYSKLSPAQNLHIGIDECTDANRTGIFLLNELDRFTRLLPKRGSLQINSDLDIFTMDQTVAIFTDNELQQIIRRAITLVNSPSLGADQLHSAINMQREMRRLGINS